MEIPQNDTRADMSDMQLFLAISKGSEMAFQFVFERYRQPMWSFVMTLVKSPHIAEDIIQESFIKLWERRDILTEVVKPKDFIFILVRNRALDALRRLATSEKEKEKLWVHLKQQSDYSDYYLEAEQASQILKDIIDQLPAQQQKAFTMSRDLGLSHQDIADELKISRNTVKKHISIALKTCREQLKRLGFSYYFILPLLLPASLCVFKANEEEKDKQTTGRTVVEVCHEYLQQGRI
jgi:RNA polymerase sigma-70 factor (ECF subfamily)